MPFREISTTPTLDTPARVLRGTQWKHCVDHRLDLANQKRGDFKETFNMGKFTDKEYQQKLPPILTSHWTEIQQFQEECHSVTLKVLTLFGLALNVSAHCCAFELTAVTA